MSTQNCNTSRPAEASPECFLVAADAMVLSVLSKYRNSCDAAYETTQASVAQALPTAA